MHFREMQRKAWAWAAFARNLPTPREGDKDYWTHTLASSVIRNMEIAQHLGINLEREIAVRLDRKYRELKEDG